MSDLFRATVALDATVAPGASAPLAGLAGRSRQSRPQDGRDR